jgi:putative ABC transport system substrate-binding protein
MRRRELMTLLGIIAVARSRMASAQQSAKRLIGVLSNPSGDRFETIFPAFHRGLSESGYVEGQNVAIEY